MKVLTSSAEHLAISSARLPTTSGVGTHGDKVADAVYSSKDCSVPSARKALNNSKLLLSPLGLSSPRIEPLFLERRFDEVTSFVLLENELLFFCRRGLKWYDAPELRSNMGRDILRHDESAVIILSSQRYAMAMMR